MYLTREPIELSRFLHSPSPFSAGAEVLFLGRVRDHSEGKKVLYLEYEAYEEMAERILQDLTLSSFRQWPLEEIKLIHRLGKIELGEIAVAINVCSAHRDEAYKASRYLIEEIKHQVPIWKKEFFADGTSEWSHCQHHVELQASA